MGTFDQRLPSEARNSKNLVLKEGPKLKTAVILILASALALMMAGCGGGGGGDSVTPVGRGTLTVKVDMPSGLTTSGVHTMSVSEITMVAVTVTGTGIATINRTITLDPTTHTGTDTFSVPAGVNLTIKADAKNAEGNTIYSGSANATLAPGESKAVDITLQVVNGSVQVVIIIHAGPPALDFTYVPPIGSYNALQGIVTGGLNPKDLAVAVYIKVNDGWWTKPYWNSPLTTVNADGTWICLIVTGGHDEQATEILAFLVKSGESVPSASGGGEPSIPGAYAVKRVTR